MLTALSTRLKDICLVRSGLYVLSAGWLAIASAISPLSAQTVNPEDSLRAGLTASKVLEAERQAFIVARQAIATSNAKNDLTGTFALSGSHIQTDKADTPGGFTSSNSRSGSITLRKQIYDFGEAGSRMESARYGLDSARASYQSSEQQVILTILTAHLNVITAQKAYDIRSNNTKRLTAQTEAENIKVEAGTSTPTRLAEAEARLARAKSDEIQAAANLRSAEEAYQSLTGLDNYNLRPLARQTANLPNTIEEAEQIAGIEHPLILSGLAAVKQAGIEFKILKTSLLPKLNFSLSAVQNDQQGTSMDKDEVTSKLEFSTPFLVTEGSRAADRRAAAGVSRSRAQLAETRRNVRLTARKAFRDYEVARAQLASVEAEINAARLVAQGTASEVEYGLKTFLDQLDAEQSLSDTELRLVQTQEAINLNGYRLLQAIGRLSVEMFLPEDILPALDSISDPASRYPFIIAIPSGSRAE